MWYVAVLIKVWFLDKHRKINFHKVTSFYLSVYTTDYIKKRLHFTLRSKMQTQFFIFIFFAFQVRQWIIIYLWDFFKSRIYGNLFLKHNIILNWECCLPVCFLQLHRMILQYEFFKKASIYSAFEKKEVISVILKNLINALPSIYLYFKQTLLQKRLP